MSDRDELVGYVDTWWGAIESLLGLLEQLEPEEWALPTDLPGWDVHAVAAHVAHLESVLAANPQEPVRFDPPPHVRGPIGMFTEQGVIARRERAPADLIGEIRSSTTARRAELAADPPTDGAAPPRRTFPGVPWDTRTLLSNRVIDIWMHEQDLRRAVGRPGNLDSPAAAHTERQFLRGLPLVLAKRAAASAGATLVLDLAGATPVAVGVRKDGRGHRLREIPEQPTVRLAMDREAFVVLAGGRRPASALDDRVEVTGDGDLARRILAGLALTP